ncbi:MAG: hypothetical protein mread185_000665 [Mycoplasmataceae bacterium]|nr:MAG: hypothetical protein mread185_000665 [Mycoplasmataceae bacterium]
MWKKFGEKQKGHLNLKVTKRRKSKEKLESKIQQLVIKAI